LPVDPLAEIVTMLKPDVRFSKLVEGSGAWRIHREASGEPFYCALLEGSCRLTIGDDPAIVLNAGDFVLAPSVGTITNESIEAPSPGVSTLPTEVAEGTFRVGDAGEPVNVRLRIGYCSFASPDASLLVPLLPQVAVVRSQPRLAMLMQLLADETRSARPARELVLERLLEVLLIEALRGSGEGASAPSLARGLADERLAIALRALHHRPQHPWTVPELADRAAMSRSAFFARFNRIVGLPPMEYLLAWRMSLARRLLRTRDLPMEQIAEHVGYSSASAFSVAFARHMGEPPARYARSATTRDTPLAS